MVKGVVTYERGVATGELPGRLLRNPHAYAGQACDVHAAFDDTFKRRIAELAAQQAVPGVDGRMDMDAHEAVNRTINENSQGSTHMSRMATALNEEAQKRAANSTAGSVGTCAS